MSTIEELLAEKVKIDLAAAEIEGKLDALRAEGAKLASEKIDLLLKEAAAAIRKAEMIAVEFNIEFEFSLEYGMGGTFNMEQWERSNGQSVASRNGRWVASSDMC